MNQRHLVDSGLTFKQGDFGFQIEIEVLDFNVTGVTPQIVFRKSIGAVESTTITVSGNKFTYTMRGTELDTPGPAVCDLKLKNSTTQRISTASFRYFVEADTLDGLNQQASSYSDTVAQIVGRYQNDVNNLKGSLSDHENLLINYKEYRENYYYNGSNYFESNAYSLFVIPVTSGEKLYIIPGCRFLAKQGSLLVDDKNYPFTYTPDFTGDLYISFYNNKPLRIVTKNADFSKVTPFYNLDAVYRELNKDEKNLFFKGVHIRDALRAPAGISASTTYDYFAVPVTSGESYIIYPGFRYIVSESNTELAGENWEPYTFTASYTGMISISVRKDRPGWIMIKSSDASILNMIRPYDTSNFNTSFLKQSSGNDNKFPMSQKATSEFVTVSTGGDLRNLFETSVRIEKNYYSQRAVASANYDYFIIPVVSGTSYRISPRLRFLAKKDTAAFVDEQTGPYTYTADFTGDLYVTMFRSDIHNWLITSEQDYSSVRPYRPLQTLLDEGNTDTRFLGKTILNIGDSISENRTGAESYSHQFANATGATVATDYGLSGSTLSLANDQGTRGCIYSQAVQAITDHSDADYDIIMIDGGTNDLGLNRTLGSIVGTPGQYVVADYTATFDESTVLGALEKIFSILRNQYVDSIIVFVIPHKNTTSGSGWEAMLTGIREACCKWSIAVLDMDRDGELNTRITAMRTDYTDEGGTHPNTAGIEKYYLPKLIHLLNGYFK